MSQEITHWRKTFSIIWAGQFLSLLSSSLVNFAIIIWLSIQTGSAEVLAWAAISALLPQSVIGLFSGVFIDRWDRKKTMIAADGFIAVCTLLIALLFYFGEMELWYLYLLLGLRSIGSAFHMPAMQASVPLLAPASELIRIAGVNQIIQSVSNIAGPALGALAIGLMDIGYVLLIDIAGAVFAIISLLFVTIPNPPPVAREGKGVRQVLADIGAGIKGITAPKGFALLVLLSVVATFCLMPVAVLFPLLTLKHFGGNTFQMSLIEVVWGLGMLAGGAVLGLWKVRSSKVTLINWMYILLGAMLALSGLLPSWGFAIFVLLTTLGGVTAAIYNASFTALIQETVDPSLLGRVFSMFFSISLLPSLFGLLGTGFLADTIGISRTFVILGCAIGLVGLISFFVPSIRRFGRVSVDG